MVKQQRKTRVTKWNIDPLLLEPLSFDQLLVLVRERDPKCPLPDSKEKAISILSNDFLGRKAE